jgi:hypothetical protein
MADLSDLENILDKYIDGKISANETISNMQALGFHIAFISRWLEIKFSEGKLTQSQINELRFIVNIVNGTRIATVNIINIELIKFNEQFLQDPISFNNLFIEEANANVYQIYIGPNARSIVERTKNMIAVQVNGQWGPTSFDFATIEGHLFSEGADVPFKFRITVTQINFLSIERKRIFG